MNNEETVWTVDDEGRLRRNERLPMRPNGTMVATTFGPKCSAELRAILERGQAPAAPSEGDGRAPDDVWLPAILDPLLDELNRLTWHRDSHETAVRVAEIFENLPDRLIGPKRNDNRPTPDPLPPGVHRAKNDDRLFLLPDFDLPGDWQWFDGQKWKGPDGHAEPISDEAPYPVRPVPPVPPTKKVAWLEAIGPRGGQLVVHSSGPFRPDRACSHQAHPYGVVSDGNRVAPIDADGRVEVLVQP